MLKPNEFYVGYNSQTNTIIPDTMYRHISDANIAMERFIGVRWKEKTYLSVKKCEVIVDVSES